MLSWYNDPAIAQWSTEISAKQCIPHVKSMPTLKYFELGLSVCTYM